MENRPSQNAPALEQIVQKLFATRDEIASLAAELSGKDADAVQRFEMVRSAFRDQLKSLRELIPKGVEGDAAQIAVRDIEESLNTVDCNTYSKFAPQTQNLLISLKKVEVNPNKPFSRALLEFEHEVERFKLKAQIFSLKLALGKFAISDRFHKGVREASVKINNMASGVSEKIAGGKSVMRNVRDEAEHVYKALRKAVNSLSK
jgi:hypothetical protein